LNTIHTRVFPYFLFFCVSFFGIISSCVSQSYQYRNYGIDNGISQPYIYTINQDKNGYLWVGTGEGLFKFDGTNFKMVSEKDGLAENFVTTSFRDNNRNLWLGHNQGSVTFYDGKNFKPINTKKFIQSTITGIASDTAGDIWFSTLNDGLLRITKKFEVEVFKFEFGDENIYSLAFTIDDKLIVGTANGALLYELTGDKRKPRLIGKIKSIPSTKIQCIVRKKRSPSFWIGTEDEGLFLLSQKSSKEYSAKQITNPANEATANVQSLVEDKESNLWIGSSGNGLMKLLLSEKKSDYDGVEIFSETDIDNKYIKSLYYDHEGNIWVGKYGSGITQITDNFFTFFTNKSQITTNNITAVFIYNTTTWLGTDNGLILANFNNNSASCEITPQLDAIGNFKITSLFQPDSTLLYIGTENSGLYLYHIKTKTTKKLNLDYDQLSNSINKIVGDKDFMWIGTKTGLFKIDYKNNILKSYNTETGLPHNNINDLLIDHNNNIWLATQSNSLTIIYKNGEIEQKKLYNGNDLVNAVSILEDKNNIIWVGTLGHGVFKVDDKQSLRIETKDGLKSGYCYSIINDGFNNIWVGHRGGLSRITPANGNIATFSKEENIKGDCNLNSFFMDKYGRAWFGTDRGLIRYDPTREKKNDIPPIINVTSFIVNDSVMDFTDGIVLPYGNYNFEIKFLGISFKANPRITYQYKLDGYDADWSNKTTNTVVNYPKFPEGEYVFLLKAFNSEGIANVTPLSIKIKIQPPFWKSWWFIFLVIAVFFYSIYLIIKIRERNHRQFQAQLQKELNIKTREVIEQKEVIEKKNKDITDSIRYAKRIQDAMLPGISKLKDVLPESFIFFQPRDIVSGDFYWFELYDTKLIVVCADATGHGVPGSLMSMIGTILLKDITSRPHILSPGHALETIDNEIKILLQQTDDAIDNTSDSIDIIICEIDIKTYKTRISTTKRPLLLSHNNKISVIKKEKGINEYETIDIQLTKGDTLYLFTDGIADQFGGAKGKKLKLPNIIEMLEEIHSLPGDKQKMIVDSQFNRWKEGYEQVDDVLFMGIKI